MPELFVVHLNGQSRSVAGVSSPVGLDRLIEALELKGDRIAVEHNGEIAPRTSWAKVLVAAGDRLEIVHFVGGGAA